MGQRGRRQITAGQIRDCRRWQAISVHFCELVKWEHTSLLKHINWVENVNCFGTYLYAVALVPGVQPRSVLFVLVAGGTGDGPGGSFR